jgi:phosphatidylglycerophosphatase A
MNETQSPAGEGRGGLLGLGPAVWLATGGWVGFAPLAPGTVGALWGLPLAWGLGRLPLWAQVVLVVVLAAGGVPLCTAAVRRLGKGKDPGAIVFDEIVSMPMTFFLVPMDGAWVIVIGFLLNRAFDIIKVPPAKRLERLPEGLGIMADDWMAGVYSCLALHAVRGLGVVEWLAGGVGA